jgi:hypothetical protein
LKELKDKITIFQNFACTKKERLEFVQDNVPKLAKVWGEYNHHINYNHTKYFEDYKKLYTDNYPNLTMYNDLTKDWVLIALSMLQEIKTPYILNYAEDYECNMTKEYWNNFVKEALLDRKVKFVNLTKIRKYTREVFPGYEDGEFGYYYDAKNSPPTRISGTGIFDREWYIQILTEYIENRDKYIDSIPYGYPELPNCLEGYLDYERGIRKYGDMKCGIPKKDIFVHWDLVTQQSEYVNKQTGQKKGNARDHFEYWNR